jgi:hypothetical protein
MGTVDPLNPKSEKLTDILKRSPFGKKNIATSFTFSRLFSILVHVNNFKDPEHGQYVKFPEGYLQKNLPTIHEVLSKANFKFDKITWIHLGQITSAGIIAKAGLKESQLDELASTVDVSRDVESLVKQSLDRYKFKETAPTPVVQASLVAPTKSSPKKK